jgi:hypothetical protein
MSIVRLTHLPVVRPNVPAGVYATDVVGNLAAPRLDDIAAFLKTEIDGKSAFNDGGGRKQPVVVMVHGFWYDPLSPIKKGEKTNNPHGMNYHFRDGQKHWRHTAGWPLGFKFEPDDKGANGLAVAFGWDSTPDALRFGEKAAVAAWAAPLARVAAKLRDDPANELRDDLVAARRALQDLGSQESDRLQAAIRTVLDAREAYRTAAGVLRVAAGSQLLLAVGELVKATQASLAQVGEVVVPVIDLFDKYAPEIYETAYRRAEHAAKVLVETLTATANHPNLAGRPIDLFCHSLGTQVVLLALKALAETDLPVLARVGRVLLVGGAAYRDDAVEVLNTIQRKMGKTPEFFNFMCRRDRVLTHIAKRNTKLRLDEEKKVVRQPIGCDGLGERGRAMPRHWVDLELDSEPGPPKSHKLNDWLRTRPGEAMAVSVDPQADAGVRPELVDGTHPLGVLNHWYYFTNPANMKLFAAIVRDRGSWPIEQFPATVRE